VVRFSMIFNEIIEKEVKSGELTKPDRDFPVWLS
jgi:hypothetical protein